MWTHPQFPAEDRDFSLGELFAQAPLDGVEAAVCGQCDVPTPNSGANGSGKDVWLGQETDAHAVGIGDP